MSDTFCFILCDLLKRNTVLHAKEIAKRGQKVTWPDVTRKVCIKELRRIKSNGGLMAFSGLLWHRLRCQNITTRCIYQLLLQWALLLTEKGLLAFYTDDYEALILELQTTIEGGAEGQVEDISPEEIIEEWEFMKIYLPEVLSEHGWSDDVVDSWGMDDELKEAMLDGMSAEYYAFEEMGAA